MLYLMHFKVMVAVISGHLNCRSIAICVWVEFALILLIYVK